MNRRSFITKTLALLSVIPFASQIAEALEPQPVKVDYLTDSGYFAAGSFQRPAFEPLLIRVTRDGVPANTSYVMDYKNGIITFQE